MPDAVKNTEQHYLGKHVEVGTAFYSSFNLGISDISASDPVTGKRSRYEAGLFNVQEIHKKKPFCLGKSI